MKKNEKKFIELKKDDLRKVNGGLDISSGVGALASNIANDISSGSTPQEIYIKYSEPTENTNNSSNNSDTHSYKLFKKNNNNEKENTTTETAVENPNIEENIESDNQKLIETSWEKFIKENNIDIKDLPKNTLSELVPKGENQKYVITFSYTKNQNNILSATVRVQNEDGTFDNSIGKIFTKTFTTTNNVADSKEIEYNGYKYTPVQFPDSPKEGWNVTGVKMSSDERMGPTIQTDAYVNVTGVYVDSEEETVITDTGYCDHGGIGEFTWGCFKSEDADVLERINYVLEAQDSGGTVKYFVR